MRLDRRTSHRRTPHLAPSLDPHAVLLPPYDEYTVAYRGPQRRAGSEARRRARNGIFGPTILMDGRIVGTWTRRLTSRDVAIALTPFARLTGAAAGAVVAAADRTAGSSIVPSACSDPP